MSFSPFHEEKLERFIGRVVSDPTVRTAINHFNHIDGYGLVTTYANEARVGFGLVAPLLRPRIRVLEVGCGIGALLRFMLDEGIDITGIEPGASGFGFMPELSRAILGMAPRQRDARLLPIGAGALNPLSHGVFDLIYSTNVLEHIPDLDNAFRGMSSVLAPGGTMVHLCPNYLIPYEPHFGIPLLPMWPSATRYLFQATIARYPGVWEDLNFITSRHVQTLARKFGLKVTFDNGVLSRALCRFDEDPTFRARQGWIARLVQRACVKSGAISFLDKLPGALVTPMIMRITHANADAAIAPQEVRDE